MKRLILALILCLLFISEGYSASSRRTGTNESISTYGVARDYSVLATWEADTDVNLVTATTSYVLECYDDAASYDDYVTLAGATTSSTYFRIIRPAGVKGQASWQGHDGTPNNGVYFLSTTNTKVFYIAESYFQIQDLIATLSIDSSDNQSIFQIASCQNAAIVGCMAINGSNIGSGSVNGFELWDVTNPMIVNCLAHNNDNNGFYSNISGLTHRFYNCASTNNTNGGFTFAGSSGEHILTNCLASGNTNDFDISGAQTKTVNYCASGDLSADDCSGAGNRTGATFSFVDSVGDDFHLLSTDNDAVNLGTSLAADAVYAFDDDIDFQTITTWDIGFDDSFLFVDTVDERSCVINLLRPSGRVLPMPDATIAVNDRYHVAWYYYIVTGAGSGQESIHGGGLGDDVIIMSPPPLW